MSSIKVYLDNYNDCCYAGQTVSGRVECYFNKEKKIRAIRIKFKGRAETEWTESESSYDSFTEKTETKDVRYHAEEEYINAEYNLVEGEDDFRLPPGRHTYPFSYILPVHLPSSFEGSYGKIRYYVKATVDRPWKFDYEYKLSLNVISPLDLNSLPGTREPVAISVDKTMCSCWCNDSGALTFEMSLPATGFVPGQEVNIGAHVENMTNVSTEGVYFKIIANLEFITHSPSKKHRHDEKVLATCGERGIGAHGNKSWTSALTIPADLPYPNLIPCSIINLSYRLKAKVVVPCPNTNLNIKPIPLIIGTVPLAGVSTTFSADPPVFPTEGSPLLPYVFPYPNDALLGGVTVGFEGIKNSAPTATAYPSAPSPSAPCPPGRAPYLANGASFSSNSAPPSYEEAKYLQKRNEKSE